MSHVNIAYKGQTPPRKLGDVILGGLSRILLIELKAPIDAPSPTAGWKYIIDKTKVSLLHTICTHNLQTILNTYALGFVHATADINSAPSPATADAIVSGYLAPLTTVIIQTRKCMLCDIIVNVDKRADLVVRVKDVSNAPKRKLNNITMWRMKQLGQDILRVYDATTFRVCCNGDRVLEITIGGKTYTCRGLTYLQLIKCLARPDRWEKGCIQQGPPTLLEFARELAGIIDDNVLKNVLDRFVGAERQVLVLISNSGYVAAVTPSMLIHILPQLLREKEYVDHARRLEKILSGTT
ncbi:hypothetical protein [Pyrolobus fumarii]|uniref:hypothetical protein n=1 Tax=Pyrolobus fumarii TaxID=54252 RepID=UPI0014331A66|nr:hypothetical protein [Pyrolobus fumarii]